MQKNADVSNARPFRSRDAASHPGYVRLVMRWDEGPARARAACRRFASLCREEGASCGLIVAESPDGMSEGFEQGLEAANRRAAPRLQARRGRARTWRGKHLENRRGDRRAAQGDGEGVRKRAPGGGLAHELSNRPDQKREPPQGGFPGEEPPD